MTRAIIATVHPWNIANARRLMARNRGLRLITDPKRLKPMWIKKYRPRFIFFPHWSWRIPEEIFADFECVVFHMTDLPYGRGGSPLQNLIVRGHQKTKVSAIRVVRDMDAGPVYMKSPVGLKGTAGEIYARASRVIFEKMIPKIMKGGLKPRPQKGKVVLFKRRRPEDGSLSGIHDIRKIYDRIRMLDAPGYPNAFLAFDGGSIKFSKARLKNRKVIAEAEICCQP